MTCQRRTDIEQQAAQPAAESNRRSGRMTSDIGEPRSVARLYVSELTWARMAPTWRLRLMEWRHRRRRGIPSRTEFAAWAAVRTALSERGVRLPEP